MSFFSKFWQRPNNVGLKNKLTEVCLPDPVELGITKYERLKQEGVEFLDEGKYEDAERVFSAAFEENPVAESHLNLGFALLEQRRTNEAKVHFDQATRLGPESFDAHLLRAMVAISQADSETALAAIKTAIDLNTSSSLALGILYKLLAVRGEFEKIDDHVRLFGKAGRSAAEIRVELANIYMRIPSDGELRKTLLTNAKKHLNDAIGLDPLDPDAHTTLGRLFLTLNDLDLAVKSYQTAISINVTFAPAFHGLARAFRAQGNTDQSVISAKNAVLADPSLLDAYKLLAELSTEKCAYQDAVMYYKKVLEIEPDTPDVLIMLGVVYADLQQYKLALDTTRQAVILRKNSPEVHFALGNILSSQNLFSEAVDSYRLALKLNPEYLDAQNNLASKLLAMGQGEEALEMYEAIAQADPKHIIALQNIAFALSYKAGCLPIAYLDSARKFGNIASAKAHAYTSWHQTPLIERPLKVGLVSGDLRRHPVGLFLESVLTYFDIERIEIHAFSNLASVDDLQASLKSRVSYWTSIAGIPDEAAAKLIHDAELDLLIDLSGHTGAGRLALFSWRPAPVQATWLGFWASTGVAEIDYILTDRHSVLAEHHSHFSETVWYMADTRLCFTPPTAVFTVLPSKSPMAKRGFVTFGCFQSIRKLNQDVLALWGRIYQQLPSAHFRLQGAGLGDQKIRVDLLERLADVGIPADKVTLHNSMAALDYLKAHSEVDIILDSCPYPGGTTTCEALWMGVPTVTRAGDTMLSRQGVSLLTYAGLVDWVAQTDDEYVAIAVQKAGKLEDLSRLRATLRQQVFKSPLFNAPNFANNFVETLRAMVLHKRPELSTPLAANTIDMPKAGN